VAVVVAASAIAGVAIILSRPDMDPRVVALEKAFLESKHGASHPAPVHTPTTIGRPEPREAPVCRDSLVMCYVKPIKFVIVEPPRPPEARILPVANVVRCASSLEEIVIAWELENQPVPLKRNQKRLQGDLQGFIVERAKGEGPFEPIAMLEAKAAGYTDRAVETPAAYRYRVLVKGMESLDGPLHPVVKEPGDAGETRTPSPYRVKLVGGDGRIALVRVETYDRETRTWRPTTHSVKAGEKIGPTGWTLGALKFEKSTLTAEAVDADGTRIPMSTKE
jgi:hypothetical protein